MSKLGLPLTFACFIFVGLHFSSVHIDFMMKYRYEIDEKIKTGPSLSWAFFHKVEFEARRRPRMYAIMFSVRRITAIHPPK